MSRLVDDLTSQRIPVSSYSIGPPTNGQFLAALANHSGGVLAVDSDNMTGFEAGRFLAAAADEVVAWPTGADLPEGFTAVYPKTLPPLRADRDTILVGEGAVEEPAELT